MATQLLLAKPKARIAHTYLHDLESFFWVLLYTVAEHREGGAELNEDASAVLSKLERIDPSTLGEAKYLLLGQIVSGNLNVESFNTAWSVALAPMIVEFAKWTHGMVFENPNSTVVDPDFHFETILTIFLNAANDVRPEPKLKETQTTHVCSSTGECGASCPLRDTRREGEEPKISRSSKGSSDLP
ncbi:hypothetical protein CTheo_9151 [Ceratobasidium theobromae]|uniref:Fungal-type protein kinase domain-containing protein n=1 Tax=Ceratobasidium theobromae TaxID=1582974 RepID=A0A5N5Q7J8_9AGAM|nr:hypothetical protein CTheo_9151 [Ceratobasidium theobromae]